MSDQATIDAETAAFLESVPLLEGMPDADLAELARVMRRQELAPGEVLWREGDEAKGVLLVVAGRVSVSVPLPGDRQVEVTSLGPGEILGEVALIDGGKHSATAMVAETATLLTLSRPDFVALVSRRHPTAVALEAPHRRRGLHAAARPPGRARRHARRRRGRPRTPGARNLRGRVLRAARQ